MQELTIVPFVFGCLGSRGCRVGLNWRPKCYKQEMLNKKNLCDLSIPKGSRYLSSMLAARTGSYQATLGQMYLFYSYLDHLKNCAITLKRFHWLLSARDHAGLEVLTEFQRHMFIPIFDRCAREVEYAEGCNLYWGHIM